MDVESVKCKCCGMKEDCTLGYMANVRARFHGNWLCGLCAEVVTDETIKGKPPFDIEEAIRVHMAFCRKFMTNPAVRVADGMRQLLRRSGRHGIQQTRAGGSHWGCKQKFFQARRNFFV